MAAVRTLDLDAFQDGPQQCNEAAAEIRDSVKSFNLLFHILSLLESLRAEETRVQLGSPCFFLQEVDGSESFQAPSAGNGCFGWLWI